MELKFSKQFDEALNKRRDAYANEIKVFEEFLESLKEKERELERVYRGRHQVNYFLLLFC